jgi:protein-tyrosine phosphatase
MTGERAPSRHVALDGAVNVRDIGGYRIVGGPEVVRGRLYRGDSLSQLTSSDVQRLDRLGLRTVIDFRTPGEVLLGGDDHLPFAVEYAHLPVSGGDLGAIHELIASGDHERQWRELGGGRAASFMVEMNRGFVADAKEREAFGAALRLLCSPGRLPLLYHCTGGKDRTGWMTAIILTALGVPRELVLRDYLLSNDFHRTDYQKLRFDLVKTGIVADPELVRPILELSATYLGAAFEEADRQFGSFGRFLAYGLEVSEVMLTGLRRAMLGDLVPPEPVALASGRHLRRRGPRVRSLMYASSANTTASAAMMPMSRSQFAEVCFHSGSKGGAWLIWLRFTVLAVAARPQRDGDITESCLSPTLSASGTT